MNNKKILQIFIFFLYIISFGCGDYNSIKTETLSNRIINIKFPIKIILDEKNTYLKLVKNSENPDILHHIEIDSIKKIIINDIEMEGLFSVTFYNDNTWSKQINRNEYLYYSITIKVISQNFMEIFNKIIYQKLPLMPVVTDFSTVYIDLDNKISYNIQNSKEYITIDDVGYAFKVIKE